MSRLSVWRLPGHECQHISDRRGFLTPLYACLSHISPRIAGLRASRMKETTIYIEDMCCENEARVVKASVQDMNGIKGCDVNLVSRSLKVSYDPSLISLNDLLKAIGKTGMKASLQKEEKGERPAVWWRQPRLLALIACGLFIFSGFVIELILGLPHGQARLFYGIAVIVGGYYPAKM